MNSSRKKFTVQNNSVQRNGAPTRNVPNLTEQKSSVSLTSKLRSNNDIDEIKKKQFIDNKSKKCKKQWEFCPKNQYTVAIANVDEDAYSRNFLSPLRFKREISTSPTTIEINTPFREHSSYQSDVFKSRKIPLKPTPKLRTIETPDQQLNKNTPQTKTTKHITEVPAKKIEAMTRATSATDINEDNKVVYVEREINTDINYTDPIYDSERPCTGSNHSIDDMCRICHGGDSVLELGPLVSACLCRGTVGRMHVKCLERWLTESGKTRCELCGTKYSTRRVHKYGVLKALLMWVVSQNAKQLMVDSLGIMLMSPLAVLAAWLSGRTLAGLMAQDSQVTPWPLASTFVLACMTLVCYYCWIVSAATRHALGWWIWYRSQYEVKLELTPSAEEETM